MLKHLHLGLVALAMATSTSAFAATPINDAAGLAAMSNDLSGEYELTADITLAGEWTPVGNNDAPFTGKLNGNGHTITGLTNTTNGNWIGLFGAVSGTVQNVRIEGANIYGNEHVGIVAGRVCNGGVITQVFTSGFVNGRDHTGGIAGDAGEGEATVSNCMSMAYVMSRDYQAGGIVGWTKGTPTLSNNLFLGEAICNGWAGCGGIVGFVEDGTTTVTKNVCAAHYLKGNSFDSGKADTPGDQRQTRGIIGCVYNDNSLVVSSDNLISSATVIYDREGNAVDQSAANMTTEFNGIQTPAADLQKAATYTGLGWGSAWNLATGNYPVIAGMTLPVNGDLIVVNATIPEEVYTGSTLDLAPISTFGREVSIETSNALVASVEGTVVTFNQTGTATITLKTTGDSFCAGATLALTFNPQAMDTNIATAADIEKMRENPQGNFKLTADIDMTGVDFTPIPTFSGSLDGQGHYIRNLTFNNTQRSDVGLFANFNGTFVKNIGFENLNLVGDANVAAVAGKTTSASTISGVVVSNSYIEGRDHVASITGNLDGNATITNCLSNAQIATRSYQAGGIVGVINYGTIDKVIFAGTVTSKGGATNVTGMASLLDSDGNPSTIKNCLAAAVTYANANSDANNIVALAGRSMTLENNYTTEYSIRNGIATTTGAADSESGAPATKADVRSQAWYITTLGFNFSGDWKFLAGGEGQMLPVLAWMNAPLTTTIFGLPSEDGVTLNYTDGGEYYPYTNMMGSWGQDVEVEQINGFDYATAVPEEGRIYPGNADMELPDGGTGSGSAEFKLVFNSAITGLFNLEGRNTFTVNVAPSGAEITISTVEQFLKIRTNPAANYILEADIDLAGVDFNGFCNDGNTSFTGTIDGQGHAIKNFHLTFDSESNKGLFGKTSGAKFTNVAFTDFTIEGASGVNHVGLIGQGSATFENVAIAGSATGDDHVGLVAGDADGITMTNCYATGYSTGRSQVGGYFGCTLEGGCTLENCLSNVIASATFRGWVGGFIGLVDKANSTITIKNCVSIGDCISTGDGSPHVAAPFIAGNNAGDTPNAIVFFSGNIANSAAIMNGDTEWPSKNETAEGGSVEATTAQNPNALTMQNTYTAIGWDFANIWSMGTGAYKYPVLSKVNVSDATLSGVEDVIAETAESVVITPAEGNITVAGLGETAFITVYTAAGMQVAAVSVAAPEAVVTVPSAGLYIVSVATGNTTANAKVFVK